MRRMIALVSLIIVASVLLALPVLAYSYRAQVAVSENTSTDYGMLAVMWDSNNGWMVANGFMSSTALDTRVQTLGGLNKPHMVTENKTLTAIVVSGDSQSNLYFVTGESDLSAMDIIVGYTTNSSAGYISVVDEDSIELSDNFTIEQRGWVNTDNGSDKNLVYKESAFKTYVSGTGNITSEIDGHNPSFTRRVTASADDCFRRLTPSAFSIPSVTVEVGAVSGISYELGAGIRFTNIAIGQGKTILSANITFQASQTQSGNNCNSKFSAEDVKNASNFSGDNTTTFDARFANHTTAMVAWDTIPAFTADSDYTSPDLSTIIQEMVDRSDWASGDSIVIFWEDFEDRSTDGAFRRLKAWDGDSNNAPLLSIEYSGKVVATGVSSGEHTVTTTADSVNLTISIDGATSGAGYDSVTLSGFTVSDNESNWAFLQNNVMPYADNITIWVGGTKELWFEPIAIIVDIDGDTATLPDRATSVANDGTIYWGSNPTGVGVDVGGMASSGQPGVGVTAETPSRDLLPEVGVGDWDVQPDVTGALLTNPFRPFVTLVSDNTTLTELQAWRWLGLAIVFLVTAMTIRAVPRHLAIACAGAGIATVAMVVLTIWPLWALVLLVLCAFGGWVSERSPSL